MKYLSLCGRTFVDGGVCLKYRIDYPAPSESEGVSDLPERLAKECESFCRNILTRELGACAGYCYRASLHIERCCEGVGLLRIRAELKKGRECIRCFEWEAYISSDDGLLMPPSMARRKIKKESSEV